MNELQSLDYRHLWHPYTDMAAFPEQPWLCVEKAEGVYLHLSDGRRLIDGIASWWCVNLGHGNRKIIDAIQAQAEKLQHCMIGGMSHPSAIELAAKIAEICPGSLNRVYFAADGSSAVEAALKMAVQYWRYMGHPEKSEFVSFDQAYHGDTIGAMEVGYISWFEEHYGAILRPAHRVPSPHARSSDPEAISRAAEAAYLTAEELIAQHHRKIAGFIVEPLVQGAAGIRIYPESYLQRIVELCRAHNVLLIADEIATGFGRTGAMFACDKAGIEPDIICVGKGLTGGYLPLSAAVARDHIYEPFLDETSSRVFYDGHTFCGNPITCAAALAALEQYPEVLSQSVPALAREMESGFAALAESGVVEYTRSLGVVGMLAIKQSEGGAARAKQICAAAVDAGLYLRPLGEVLYLWPPLTMTEDELQTSIEKISI